MEVETPHTFRSGASCTVVPRVAARAVRLLTVRVAGVVLPHRHAPVERSPCLAVVVGESPLGRTAKVYARVAANTVGHVLEPGDAADAGRTVEVAAPSSVGRSALAPRLPDTLAK